MCVPERINQLTFFGQNKHVSLKSVNFLKKRRQKRLPWLKGRRRKTAMTMLNRLRNSDLYLATNQLVSEEGNCILAQSPGYVWKTLGYRDVNNMIL